MVHRTKIFAKKGFLPIVRLSGAIASSILAIACDGSETASPEPFSTSELTAPDDRRQDANAPSWAFTQSLGVNDDWLEVSVMVPEGSSLSKVQVVYDGQVGIDMARTDWGSYALNQAVVANKRYLYRAWDAQGRFHDSLPHLKSGALPYSGTFAAVDPFWTFAASPNNGEYWAEVSVGATAGLSVSKVELIVQDSSWLTLNATAWGAYAINTKLPLNANAFFRAWDQNGSKHDSLRFTLNPGSTTSPSPPPLPGSIPTQPQNPRPQTGKFNYGEAVQKALLFLEINRSGRLPANNRIEWRGNSGTNDGSDVGLDLSGGYYDAGDHVKFGQPMALTVATLAWSIVEYADAYKSLGQLDEALDAIKWGTDYFLKAHRTDGNATTEFYVQVGNGDADHAYWGPPENMTMARPAYKVTRSKPGSDVTADTAAALAAAAIAFRPYDTAYADKLLLNAKQLFAFAETYKGKYSDSVPEVSPFYTSWSGYQDELVWGAAWLHRATGDATYLSKATNYYDSGVGGLGDWSMASDDKRYGAAVLLAQAQPGSKYTAQVEGWLNQWIYGNANVKHTDGGFAWRAQWGSAALSVNTAFLAQVFHDRVSNQQKYTDFARRQIDYILGDNPRKFSYVVGFGDSYPRRSHHRASHGRGWEDYSSSNANSNIAWGSLVGGLVSPNDYDYVDERSNVYGNEGGTSYNAPLSAALIALYAKLGGVALTDAQLSALPGIR